MRVLNYGIWPSQADDFFLLKTFYSIELIVNIQWHISVKFPRVLVLEHYINVLRSMAYQQEGI